MFTFSGQGRRRHAISKHTKLEVGNKNALNRNMTAEIEKNGGIISGVTSKIAVIETSEIEECL